MLFIRYKQVEATPRIRGKNILLFSIYQDELYMFMI